MRGEEETFAFNEQGAGNDGEITEAGGGGDAFFVFMNVGEFDDDTEAFGECPFELQFGFVFGEAIALEVGVIEEKVAAGEGGFNQERVDERGSALAGVDVLERSEKAGSLQRRRVSGNLQPSWRMRR